MASSSKSDSPNIDEKNRRRIWYVEAFWYFQRSQARVLEEFKKAFPGEPVPARSVLHNNVMKFHENGTALDLIQGHSVDAQLVQSNLNKLKSIIRTILPLQCDAPHRNLIF